MPCDPVPPPEAHACGLRVGGDLASALALYRYAWLHATGARARAGVLVRGLPYKSIVGFKHGSFSDACPVMRVCCPALGRTTGLLKSVFAPLDVAVRVWHGAL